MWSHPRYIPLFTWLQYGLHAYKFCYASQGYYKNLSLQQFTDPFSGEVQGASRGAAAAKEKAL